MYSLRRLAVQCSSARGCVVRSLFDQNVVYSPLPEMVMPQMPLTEFVWKDLPKWQDKVCVECGVTGRKFTFAQTRDGARRFAVSLQKKLGMKPRDVLAVVLPNIPEYPVAVLGAIEADIIVTTVSPNFTAGEIAKQLVDSGASCVVTDVGHYELVHQAIAEMKKPQIPVIIAGSTSVPAGNVNFQELIDHSVDISTPVKASPSASINDVVVLPYSSGTTGLPKGVMLSHKNLVSNLTQIHSKAVELSSPTTATHQDVVPGLLPFYHIYGMVVVLLDKICIGSKIVSLPKFEPASYLDTIVNHKANLLFLAPPLVLFLAARPEVDAKLLKSVKNIISGAAPLGASDMERLMAKCPPHTEIKQGYGMTETSPVMMHLRNGCKKRASVGPPVPNLVVKVVDVNTGEALGPGQTGEVCCQGPQVMVGYHKNPKATAEMIDKDGWLHTGDIGHYDEDLDFYITDRLKELIKVKGLQVAPAELEELLRSHPKVADAAVLGVPDERAGQVPRAIVVPKKPGSLTELELTQFVAKQVSEHKQLTGGVKFVESIPKSPSGKILRRQLKGV